jgi:hypothetical protein
LRVVGHLENRIAHMGDKTTHSYSAHAPIKRIGRSGA